jgi:GDPmannose 4,6-dehydratase
MVSRALITGITGQDGSYLAELLLSKGYEVHGIIRRSSSFNTSRIDHIFDRLNLHYGDMTDSSHLSSLVHRIKPTEIYNLAAQSHVAVSFECPEYTTDVNYLGTLRLLEAIKAIGGVRMYQASTSEMFGNTPVPQSEATPMRPTSPYAISKLAAHKLCQNYRRAYGVDVSCGILFNHESPRRGGTFVTKKITDAAKRIKRGKQDKLHLWNINANRDWGFAGDYVRAMWMMLQSEPDDYVIATGEMHSVRDVLDVAFEHVGLDWHDYIVIDKKYSRPTDVGRLCGDATKARDQLGWKPDVGFRELITMMMESK